MKKVLLASTALVFAGGMAMADVEVSGSAKMGITNWGESDDVALDDPSFLSEVGFSFTGSGETDGGLTFGASLDADDSGDANQVCTDAAGDCSGASGSVFVEGAFGRLSMGDVDGAAEAAVGDVSGVGLDLPGAHETAYIASVGTTPGALYENSFGDATFYLSAGNPGNPADSDDEFAVGVSYGFGNYTVALGYEDNGTGNHIVGGVSAGFGDATLKAIYGTADDVAAVDTQWAVSLDYVFGATTVTAFYKANETAAGVDTDATGLGVAYDLGGGASLKAGVIDADAYDETLYDFGVSMSF